MPPTGTLTSERTGEPPAPFGFSELLGAAVICTPF